MATKTKTPPKTSTVPPPPPPANKKKHRSKTKKQRREDDANVSYDEADARALSAVTFSAEETVKVNTRIVKQLTTRKPQILEWSAAHHTHWDGSFIGSYGLKSYRTSFHTYELLGAPKRIAIEDLLAALSSPSAEEKKQTKGICRLLAKYVAYLQDNDYQWLLTEQKVHATRDPLAFEKDDDPSFATRLASFLGIRLHYDIVEYRLVIDLLLTRRARKSTSQIRALTVSTTTTTNGGVLQPQSPRYQRFPGTAAAFLGQSQSMAAAYDNATSASTLMFPAVVTTTNTTRATTTLVATSPNNNNRSSTTAESCDASEEARSSSPKPVTGGGSGGGGDGTEEETDENVEQITSSESAESSKNALPTEAAKDKQLELLSSSSKSSTKPTFIAVLKRSPSASSSASLKK